MSTEPPEGLSDEALAYWPDLMRQMQALGVLHHADRLMLAELCSSLAESARYRRQLDALQAIADEALAEGDLDRFETASTQVKRVRVARSQALAAATKLAEMLGLTPVGRLRLGVRGRTPYTELFGPSPNDPGAPPPEPRTA